MSHIKKEVKTNDLDFEYEVKMHDADVLENLIVDVPLDLPLDQDKKDEIVRSCRNIIEDVLHDNKIDMDNVSANELR